MEKLTPIQTRYKGYLFRSRLEARWAVFFEALGLKWEYEPEGFELKAGRYLPDFKVQYPSDGLIWFEVKLNVQSLTQHDWARLVEFNRKETLFVLDGTPDHSTYLRATDLLEGKHVKTLGSPNEKYEYSPFKPYTVRIEGLVPHSERWGHSLWTREGRIWWWDVYQGSNPCEAVEAARSARFEFSDAA